MKNTIKHNEKCTYQNEYHYWEIIEIKEEIAEIKCCFCKETREIEIPKINIDLTSLNENELLDLYDFQHAMIAYEMKKESEEKLKKNINYIREIKDFLRKLRVHND